MSFTIKSQNLVKIEITVPKNAKGGYDAKIIFDFIAWQMASGVIAERGGGSGSAYLVGYFTPENAEKALDWLRKRQNPA